MEQPSWLDQLVWSPARPVRDLDRRWIPPGSGIYAFTRDRPALGGFNVLYVGKADGGRPTLRSWTGVVAARDVEGTLIELYDPCFNNRDEHRHGFAFDERIPEELLYTWP